MGRIVEVDIDDLLDIYFGGLDGDWQDYLADFLLKDLKVTQNEVREFAKKLGETKGYGKEDEEVVLDKARWFLFKRPIN